MTDPRSDEFKHPEGNDQEPNLALTSPQVEAIAKACHEANRAYCQSIGDNSQPAWDDAPQWQKDSAINGVKFHLANPNSGPSASHDNWMREKVEAGWVYGPEKNPNANPPTHPCLVPYDQLPEQQRHKDALFIETIHKMIDAMPADAETAKAFDENGVKPGDIIETDAGDKIRIGADTPPDVFSKPHSKTPASCGRIVHVYSNRWTGPRPGLVTQAWGVSDTHQLVNVTVAPDGCNDSKWLSEMAKTGQGTSLGSVGLYDPLTPEERSALIDVRVRDYFQPPRYHCEWMPFQAGQATRTQAAEGDLAKRLAAAEAQLAKATVALAMLEKSSAFNLKATDPSLHQHLTNC